MRSASRTRTLTEATALAGAAALAFASSAGAACAPAVTYLGAPFTDAGSVPSTATGSAAGRAVAPGCDDVAGPGVTPDPPRPAQVIRVDGVAPRYAVALPAGSANRAPLLMADGVPCPRSTAQTLTCLRSLTARLQAGPALISPPAARAGATVRVALHMRAHAQRDRFTHGLELLLQRHDGQRFRPAYRLYLPLPGSTSLPDPVPASDPPTPIFTIGFGPGPLRPVRLPDVEPGLYRLVLPLSSPGGRALFAAQPLAITR